MKESDHRDRAVKQLFLDSELQDVIEFMQDHISAGKLIAVAKALPQIATLLWKHIPQEPALLVRLEVDPIVKMEVQSRLRQDASGSTLEEACVDGGSGEVGV
jgi:hypothetical protein